MARIIKGLTGWLATVFRVWRREFKLVFTNLGVMIFFFGLPTLYPIVYTLIYNPELVRDVPVVVVDRCNTARSRELARMFNRTQTIEVIGYAAEMGEAREAMNGHDCFGVLEIPADYDRKLGRGEQAVVPFYCEMSLLLRYRQIMFDLSSLQLTLGTQVQTRDIHELGLVGSTASALAPRVQTHEVILGDPTQGFASFCMPGILVLIIQQSIVLGVVMLAASAAERRRANGGYDPELPDVSSGALIFGRTLCVVVIYVPLVIFILHIVPWMFKLPHYGSFWQEALLILPMVLAATAFGQFLGVFATERESTFLLVVFTSVWFLFLSGLTWPRYAMGWFWSAVSGAIPATWGVEGFVRINSNAASLSQQSHCLLMLWLLYAVYFCLAWVVNAYHRRTNRRILAQRAAAGQLGGDDLGLKPEEQ